MAITSSIFKLDKNIKKTKCEAQADKTLAMGGPNQEIVSFRRAMGAASLDLSTQRAQPMPSSSKNKFKPAHRQTISIPSPPSNTCKTI